jgi:hypothetical protein
VGKSTLLAEFARQQRQAGAAVAFVGGYEPRQSLWAIAAQWGMFPEGDAREFTLWRDVADRLAQLRLEDRTALVLLDGLEPDAAMPRFVQRLACCEAHSQTRFTIAFACNPETLRALPATLRALVDLRVELDPWEESDTQAAVADDRLTPDGLAELQALTAGVARQVTRLARYASLAATAEHLGSLDGETLLAVQNDLLVY